MHSRVDLNLFVVLQAIYTEGTITAAAHRLCLTQPAVSHALGRLRGILQDPLFERHGRKMVPTTRCHLIIPQVNSALKQLHSSVAEPIPINLEQVTRTINVGLRDITEVVLLPALQQKVSAYAPGLSIHSSHSPLSSLSHSLEQGEVAIAVDAMVPAGKDILHKRVRRENFVVLCRPQHPARRGMSQDAYTSAQHVLVSMKHSEVNHVDMALAQTGLRRHISLTCEHYMAAAQLAASNDLILTLPAVYAREIVRSVKVEVVPLPVKIPPLPVHMYWHRATDNDPVLTQVRQWIADIVTQPF